MHLLPVFNSLHNRAHGDVLRMTRLTILDRVFGGEAFDRDRICEIYERHRTEVIATVPAARLLVYDLSEGWEPLCAFLGVPVPAEAFPRLNDRKSYGGKGHEFSHQVLPRQAK